jgi:hypothetical protein
MGMDRMGQWVSMVFPGMLDLDMKEPIPLPPSHKIGKGIEFFWDVLRRETAKNIPKPCFFIGMERVELSIIFLENVKNGQ